MKKLTKYRQWREEIVIKAFRTEKSVIEYINQTSNKQWEIVDLSELPPKTQFVFNLESHTLYRNQEHEFIHLEHKFLYSIKIEDFIDNFLIPNTTYNPIVENYFHESHNENILYKQIHESFDFFELTIKDSKTKILRTIDNWIYEQMINQLKPRFYEETYFAYLLLIMGCIFCRTDKNLKWVFEKRNTIGTIVVKEYYVPMLTGGSKEYDLTFAFHQKFFLYSHGFKNLFSKTYNFLNNLETSNSIIKNHY